MTVRSNYRIVFLLSAATLLPLTARSQELVAVDSPAPQQMLAEVSAPAVLTESAVLTAPESSSSSLPDDPATVLDAQEPRASLPPNSPKDSTATGSKVASKYSYYIFSDEQSQKLNSKEKIALGFRNLYAPFGFAGMVVSAGYSQVTNNDPNYGTDRGAFGQRLGASALRSISQGVFTDAILHPLMHTDSRYYVKGSNYGFFNRATYAATRIFVTKKDDGGRTVNSALLLGYLEAASLTRFYYPPINRNFKTLITGYGGSLGGEALGFVVAEFSDSVLKAVHIKH